MSLQVEEVKSRITLNEFMKQRMILATELDEFRNYTANPKWLGWSHEQWNNRKSGRTLLSGAEIIALDNITKKLYMPAVSGTL